MHFFQRELTLCLSTTAPTRTIAPPVGVLRKSSMTERFGMRMLNKDAVNLTENRVLNFEV